ncbi:hypothetical protein [Flavobacterium sp.]|uniref:hypothetical protein n=1 Tax=Flavobacterium sp. TaxID=239 RepID=UPI002632A6AE|nr:hypothetical protein [Flavobacterium sp.]
MEEYYVLAGLIIFLVFYFRITKNDFKEFFWKDSYEQFNAVRVPFITIVGIIALVIKIVKSL